MVSNLYMFNFVYFRQTHRNEEYDEGQTPTKIEILMEHNFYWINTILIFSVNLSLFSHIHEHVPRRVVCGFSHVMLEFTPPIENILHASL